MVYIQIAFKSGDKWMPANAVESCNITSSTIEKFINMDISIRLQSRFSPDEQITFFIEGFRQDTGIGFVDADGEITPVYTGLVNYETKHIGYSLQDGYIYAKFECIYEGK